MDTEQRIQAQLEKRNKIMTAASKMVWVSFSFEGIHSYPAAGTDPNLADVSFLANDHRHIFHFKVWIEIFHNDRELEFIQFKRFCQWQYQDDLLILDHKSCEMISDDLFLKIAEEYPDRDISISISEDDENGSLIVYNKGA